MKTFSSLLLLILLLPLTAGAHILDLHRQRAISFGSVLDDLAGVKVVFVGEMHDSAPHHQAQLQVIRGLVERGVRVVIGLEMFRDNSQQALDNWSHGLIGEEEFVAEFNRNWSMWPAYREIFLYAREQKLTMLGLNLEREIPRQVSKAGFKSLSTEQAGSLPSIRCDVDADYQNYIRKVLGNHAHNGDGFLHFCEAQIVWDAVMADNLLKWINSGEDGVVVVLAGNGHAWRFGIPEQIRRRQEVPLRILLPEVPGRLEAGRVGEKEADYLLLGVDEGPLH